MCLGKKVKILGSTYAEVSFVVVVSYLFTLCIKCLYSSLKIDLFADNCG